MTAPTASISAAAFISQSPPRTASNPAARASMAAATGSAAATKGTHAANACVSKTSSVNWELDLARAAQRTLRAMPTRDRERLIRALGDMKTDPLAGDITALRGEYRGLYRRRVGSWRIIF